MNLLRKIFCLALALLAFVPCASAAQVTLAWDPNPETDVAGYVIEYGTAAAPFSVSVDVGNVTTWTLGNAASGTSYVFRVLAYNTNGERSDPSAIVTADTVTPGGPTLTPDRTSLTFGLAGGTLVTPSQTVRLTQIGTGPVTWTAASSASWLQVSPAAGSGSGAFTVSVVPGAASLTGGNATINLAATGTSNVAGSIAVSLNAFSTASAVAPIGAMDTPTDNSTGVTGSIAITGWALDDVDVTHVRIYREAVAGEAPGSLVYIGDAIRVEDARPDVAAAYPNYPASYKAGWGYLALTNMFPGLGNGTFRLVVYAEDADGHATLLGTRTITCTNATSTQPFGAIDTPAPGETVSGSIYTSFGWVLARGPRRADVPGGGSVTVLIDGVAVGTPSGWAARSDLTGLFPAAQYPGVNTALAAFAFDTTTLSNGIHTMAWIATDDQGSTAGVGSRFFRVFNGSGLVAAQQSSAAMVSSSLSLENEFARARVTADAMQGRRGYDLDAPFRSYTPDADGRIVIQSEELDRVELQVPGVSSGYLLVGAQARPLPIGSSLSDGTFVWQPGPGFVGAYDLVFIRREGSAFVRQDVRIVLNAKGSNRVGPQLVVDITTPFVAGWAVDLDSPAGTGIDAIHVWAYPVTPAGHADPIFVGAATYGGERPDVAAVYGQGFLRSGYGISTAGLEPGTYDLALFAWSTATRDFLPAKVVRVTVR